MIFHGHLKELTMRSSSSFRPWLPGILLLLAPLALTAADRQAPTFEGSSQVVAVEVPVNVVGRDGEPVRGLTAGDFEVYDGNEKQKVSSFEVVDLKTMTPAAPEAAAPAPAPAELRPAARRHILLLFDLSFSTPSSILKARMAARDFVLNSLHPTDLAAVATYSLEAGPKLIVTFTPDRVQLARAVDTLGYHQALGNTKTDPLRFVIDEPDIALLTVASGRQGRNDAQDLKEQEIYDYLKSIAIAAQKEERSFEMSRISNYSRSLTEVARALNAVQGRKQVVFFSEGFDSRLLLGRDTTDPEADEDAFNVAFGQSYFVDSDQRFGNTSLQNEINRMLEQFRRADCVIQAVDIGGLRAGNDQQARPSGEGALFVMANETGGELFKDANNLREPLDRMLDRTSVTYLLTFERSDLKTDGAYHKLRVKAKLPAGAKLTHRAGYYAPRPFQQLDPLERSLLASDGIASAAPRRDLDLSVLTAPFRATPQRAYVPVIIEAGGKSLLAGEKGKRLDVEIYAYADARLLQPPRGARPRQGGGAQGDGGGGDQVLRPLRPRARRLQHPRAGAQRRQRAHRGADGAGDRPLLRRGAAGPAPPLLHGGPPEMAAGARADRRRAQGVGRLPLHRLGRALRARRPAGAERREARPALPGRLQPRQGGPRGAGGGAGGRRQDRLSGARQAVARRAHRHRHPGARQAGRHLRSGRPVGRRLCPAGGGDRSGHRAQTDEFSTFPCDPLDVL
jgi:VWFA-related protein